MEVAPLENREDALSIKALMFMSSCCLIINGAGEGNRKHPPRFFNFHQNTPQTAYLLRIIEVGGLGQHEPISHQNAPNRKKVVSNCQQNREGLRECRP